MRRAKPSFLYIGKRHVVAGHAASYQIVTLCGRTFSRIYQMGDARLIGHCRGLGTLDGRSGRLARKSGRLVGTLPTFRAQFRAYKRRVVDVYIEGSGES